jgi:uncharacterized protein (TIGR03905 family)
MRYNIMTEQFSYTPHGVCSRKIDIEINGDIITLVKYTGGCSGNTQGVSALVRGMSVDEAIERLSGIKCGFKSSSCPDQLAEALKEYKAKKAANI